MNRFLVIFSFISLFILVIWGHITKDYYLYAVSMFLFGFCMFMANTTKFSSFKASLNGVEAVLAQAKDAINELQLLAENVAALHLSSAMRHGRFGGYTDDELDNMQSSVADLLKKLGISKKDIQNCFKDWHRIVEFDYAHFILGGSRTIANVDQEIRDEWNDMRGDGFENIPDPQRIRGFLERHQLLTPELVGYLEDYEHYRRHKTHRRQEVWRERENWGSLRGSGQ